MVVRFTSLQFSLEGIADATRIYKEEVVPVIRAYPGNKSAMLLEPEDDTDDYISFSLWESPEALTNFEQSEQYRKAIASIKAVAIRALPRYFHVSDD